jgi:hypothetical protein
MDGKGFARLADQVAAMPRRVGRGLIADSSSSERGRGAMHADRSPSIRHHDYVEHDNVGPRADESKPRRRPRRSQPNRKAKPRNPVAGKHRRRGKRYGL